MTEEERERLAQQEYEKLIMVVNRHTELFQRASDSIQDLCNALMILMKHWDTTYAVLETRIKKLEAKPNLVIYSNEEKRD